MFELLRLFIVCQEVVIIVGVNQPPRADNIEFAFFEVFPVLVKVVVKIAELNLKVFSNSTMETIHIVMNALIGRFDAIGDNDFAL